MTAFYDANGALLVCTSTKQEREAIDAPLVHFVGHDTHGWSSDE